MLTVSLRASRMTSIIDQSPLYMQMICNKPTSSILERALRQPAYRDIRHASGGLCGRAVSDTIDTVAHSAAKRGTHDGKRTTCADDHQIRRGDALCRRRRSISAPAGRAEGSAYSSRQSKKNALSAMVSWTGATNWWDGRRRWCSLSFILGRYSLSR